MIDNTRITIRERSYFDVWDLALRVVRAHGWGLAAAFSVGVVPMMLLDGWLLWDYRQADFQVGFPARHMAWTLVLVAWQAPIATAAGTLYLGQVMFDERPQVHTMLRHLWQSLPQLVVYQGLLRFPLSVWPYLSEVMLLERNPMRAGAGRPRSTLGRSRTLHRGEGGDLFARAFGAATTGGMLFVSVWCSMIMVRAMLVGRWGWDDSMGTFYFPLALWIVVSYSAVARFLSYLDLRIRREGWEVELLMRRRGAALEAQG